MKKLTLGNISDHIKEKRCPKASAVVVAAGESARFGADKLTADLGGKPVIIRALEAFQQSNLVTEIVLVTREDRLTELSSLCAVYGITKLTEAAAGGATRAASSFAGVMAVSDDTDIIAIHDGARPLVTPKLVDDAVWAAYRHGSSVPAIPVRDTVKIAQGDHVVSTPDRETLRAVQTPQCFQRDVIRGALLTAQKKGWNITDDCMAVERIGGSVYITEGSEENLKITTPLDLELAKLVLEGRGQR